MLQSHPNPNVNIYDFSRYFLAGILPYILFLLTFAFPHKTQYLLGCAIKRLHTGWLNREMFCVFMLFIVEDRVYYFDCKSTCDYWDVHLKGLRWMVQLGLHTIGELRDFCSFIINNCISEHMLDENVNCFWESIESVSCYWNWGIFRILLASMDFDWTLLFLKRSEFWGLT